MVSVENGLATLEQTLNPIDWVPYVSSLSGMVRILAWSVEVVAGMALAALKMCAIVWTGKGYYSDALQEGLLYSFHGVANITRGAIALLPGINLSLFFYDNYVGRVNYEGETLWKGVYPIMTAHKLV